MTCLRCHRGADSYYRIQHENGDHGGFLCPACAGELEERYAPDDRGSCVLAEDCENDPVYSIVRTTPPDHPTVGATSPDGTERRSLENALCEAHRSGC